METNDLSPPEPVGDPPSPPPAVPAEREPRRPRIWPCFLLPPLALVLAIVLQGVLAGGIVAWLMSNGTAGGDLQVRLMDVLTSPPGFLAILLSGQLAFAGATLAAAALSPVPMKQRLGFNPLKNPVRTSTIMALGSLAPLTVCFVLVHLMVVYMPWLPTDDTFLNFFEKITPFWGVLFVILVALSPGFVEEMLFRGYIQQRLLQRWSPAWAIGVTSVMFGLVHLAPHTVVLATVLGVWLGYIAYRTGSIVPTIVCHAFVNGAVNLWRLVVKFSGMPEVAQNIAVGIFVVVGLWFFVVACRMLADYPRAEPAEPPRDDQPPMAEPIAVGSDL